MGQKNKNVTNLAIIDGLLCQPLDRIWQICYAIVDPDVVHFRAKFLLNLYILSPSRGEKPQI